MQQSKLCLLLTSLSPRQFKNLYKAVQSPLLSTNPHLVKLYTHLRKYYPDFQQPALQKQKVLNKLFPAHPYSDSKMRNLMREMTAVVKTFLLHEFLAAHPFEKAKLMAQLYTQHGLHPYGKKTITQLEAEEQQNPIKDRRHFERALALSQLTLTNSTQLKERLGLLERARLQLDAVYAMTKAELDAEYLRYENVAQNILPRHPVTDWTTDPAYQLYQQIAELQKSGQMEHYHTIKAAFAASLDAIHPQNQRDILAHLINFIIQKMKEDDALYNPIVLALYKLGIDTEILLLDGVISDHAFLNIVICAAKEKEFDWAQSFIDQHQQYLAPTARMDILTLSQAYLLFHQGAFQNAIAIIREHSFSNPYQHISARVHALRCYYELFESDSNYYDLLIAKVQAFEKFIRRNKYVLPQKQKAYLNFIQVLQKLATSQRTPADLHLQLSRFSHITSRSWLLEKLQTK